MLQTENSHQFSFVVADFVAVVLCDVVAVAVVVYSEKTQLSVVDFVASDVVRRQRRRIIAYFGVDCIGCCKRMDCFL